MQNKGQRNSKLFRTNIYEEDIMGFTDWFALGMKKNKEVKVEKIKTQSVDMGPMASAGSSEAAGALGRMMDQQNAPSKVLMVQDGEYMQQVTDYALKMAGRLDCEIIALDVTEKPLQFSGDRKTREIDRFTEMANSNAEKFASQAIARGIKVEHLLKVGNPSEVIAQLSADDAGIRYVLSKPENSVAATQERAHVPVFDLHCSKL
jgi:hypothetical protein